MIILKLVIKKAIIIYFFFFFTLEIVVAPAFLHIAFALSYVEKNI